METNEHIVYEELLKELDLKESHKNNLLERGFKQQEIEANQFKSMPRDGLTSAQINRIKKAVEARQATLSGVAGFYYEKGVDGIASVCPLLRVDKKTSKHDAENRRRNALCIPVRDRGGFIRGIKFRLDTNDSRKKYTYFSSAKLPNGCGVEPFVHWPNTGINVGDLRVLRITEGEFKSEILSLYTQFYTASIAGVTQWRNAIEEIKYLPNLQKVILCPDSDKDATVDPYTGRATGSNNVAKSFAAFAYELKSLGYEVIMETWDSSLGKGGDDVVVAHGEQYIRRMNDAEMEQFILKHGRPAFPHTQALKSGATRVLGTKENVEALCEFLGIKFRYNLMKHKEEIETTNPRFQYQSFNNVIIALKSYAIQYALPVENLPDFIDIISADNSYHPARDWIESAPWDGISRFEMFCQTLKVDKQWEKVRDFYLKKWFLSGIGALYFDDYWTKICLVLAGDGSIGKTTWFNNLFGQISRDCFKDGVILDTSNKDSRMNVVTNWCIELGELGSTFKKRDIDELKAFITERFDVIRLPYGRKSENYARQCFFAASVDKPDFLSDSAGDVRYACLPVNEIEWGHGFDMQQIWAEVKVRFYDVGETWFLNKEETEQLKLNNRHFRELDPIDEMLELAYGLTILKADCGYTPKTASEIADELEMAGYISGRDKTLGFTRRLSSNLSMRFNKKEQGNSKAAKRYYVGPITTRGELYNANATDDEIEAAASTLQ